MKFFFDLERLIGKYFGRRKKTPEQKMKLFVATNSATCKTDNIKLLEKTIKSAQLNTHFDIYLVFDGNKKEVEYLGVNVIEHRHRLYDTMLADGKGSDQGWLNTCSGAFLRTEVPYLCGKLGFKDKFVLYTDYDVLFQKGDYNDIYNIQPKTFSICSEFIKDDWNIGNTGVMIMNVDFFKNEDAALLKYMKENFSTFDTFDQTAYNNYYKGRWEKLPLIYNWKTYWGINPESKIIHFHGAKPRSIEPKWRYDLPMIKELREIDSVSYEYYNKLWEEL